MNIFIDAHIFDGFFQGTTTYLKGLYSELIKDTSKTFFFGASDTEGLKKVFGTAGNVHYVQYRSHNKFYRLLIDVPQIIKKHSIQYAHFQYIVPPFKYCKYINTVHDILFLDYPEYFPLSYRIKNRLLFKFSAKKADMVLTVSEYSRKKIREHFGIDNVIVTPNAVDPCFFEDYDKELVRQEVAAKYGFSDYWLYVSRWEPRKNHDMLLKVFASGDHYKKFSLVLVGEKAMVNKKFNAIYDALPAKVKEKVYILDKVNFQDLLLLVRGSALSLYPSIAEGFGIPPLESSASGVPTVCSNATAMAEFTFFGDMLFDPLSEAEMQAAVKYALEGYDTGRIREAVREKYSWETSAAELNCYLK